MDGTDLAKWFSFNRVSDLAAEASSFRHDGLCYAIEVYKTR